MVKFQLSEVASFQKIWENNISGRVKSECKVPEFELCSRDRKQASVGRADEQEGEW